jgi:CheY-like chemotaxis protein
MKNVLIAEDDPILSKRLSTILAKHRDKFHVQCVSNGREAMDLLKTNQFSLLITDIQMPEIDGLVLLTHVSEMYPAMPCFVMTAYNTPDLKKKLPRDLLRFFKKPFDIEKLAMTITSVLDQDIPSGAIYGISVISFLQMIHLEQKTCLFEVDIPNQGTGVFYFERGVLYNAVFGKLKGDAAAIELISGDKGKFRFKHLPDKKIAKRIQMSLQEIIAEAMSRKEELDDIDWDDILE